MSVVLRGMTWEHPRGFGSAVASAARYEELHPEVRIEWEQRSLHAFATDPLDVLAERYDLLVIDHPHIALAADQGILLHLQGRGHDAELDLLAERSVGASHDSYRYGGDQLALAVDAATQVAVYRPDLLAEPPRTWEAVLQLATTGQVLWPAGPIDAYSSLLTTCVNLGGRPFEGTAGFLEPSLLVQALGLLRRLAASASDTSLATNPIEVAELMSTESRWSYCPLLYGYTNYSRQDFRPHRLRYCNMPDVASGGSLLGGTGIAVSTSCRHPAEAVAHAYWLASAAVQRTTWFEGGGQPAHADAWEDAKLDDSTFGFFSGTRATIDSAWVRPQHPLYTHFQDRVAPLVSAYLVGGLGEDALISALNVGAAELGVLDAGR